MNELAQPATVGKPLRYLSVCSGMEAASVAWHPLGWTPVGFSEIEPFPCAILKHRFPNTPNYGSLTEYQSWPLEPGAIDLLVGGCPCQSFSVAGLRRGMQDPRGNLTLTYLGLADKLKPKWIVYENVPGLLSSNGGKDFGAFLGALVELGYGFAYRVLDAQYVGGPRAVPQRRRRVFVVACLGDWRAPAEVLSITEGVRGYLETGNKKRKSPAADAGSGVEAGRKWPADVACTLNAHFGDKQGLEDQHALGGGSLFVPAETIGTLCARDYKGVGNQYVQEGKCIPCPAPTPYRKSKRACSTTDNETLVEADASNTLNNFDLGDKTGALAALPGTHQSNYIAEPLFHVTQSEIAGPLDAHYYKGPGSRQGGEREYVAHAIPIHDQATRHAGKRGDKQDGKGNGLGIGHPGDPMNTLTRGDHHAVATAMAVRRLTPNECYRLQGFPDNWGRIPWKGKPAEECPDGPQYKACGNSMAVPVMRWIGERIANYELSQNHETK